MKFVTSKLLAAASLMPLLATLAVADTIELRREENGRVSQQTISNVTVKGVEGEELVFVSQSGNDARRPLANVFKLEIKGETALNEAEAAFAEGKPERYAAAAEAYNRALRLATKDWIRDRASLRLVDVAGKTNRFDAAAAGYISLVTRNPALAATVKPALPEDKTSKSLTDAVAEIDKALNDAKLAQDRRVTLLQFALEIHQARGDKKAAGETVEQIIKLGALNLDDPAAAKQLADFRVAVAQLSLDNKEYAKAQAAIEQNRAVFTEPHQQVEALYILAESQYQQALAAKKTDKTTWQDIAITYMRVVANFKDSPRAAEALARTAACYEQMQDPKGAAVVYQQVIRDFASTPSAKTAQASIERLKSATGG